jgi:hypothetical protein
LITEIAIVAVLPAALSHGETVARLELKARVPLRVEAEVVGLSQAGPEVRVQSNSATQFTVKVAPAARVNDGQTRLPASEETAEIHVVTIEAP